MLCASHSLTSRLILPAHKPPPPGNFRGSYRSLRLTHRTTSRRGISVVTRAGPSATTYAIAIVLPLSLLAVTIFASVRVADELDEKFLEELTINEAILEAEEDDDGGDGSSDEVNISLEREPASPRRRNRPKRAAEPSSK